MKCVNCGNEIPDGASFCTACGQPVNVQPTPQPSTSDAYAGGYTAPQTNPEMNNNAGYGYGAPAGTPNGAPNYNNGYGQPDDGMDYKPISMWGYFGYELLFAIPCVGFILLLVFSFGGTKNINLRNFARSYFCMLLIGVVIFIVMLVVFGGLAGIAALGSSYNW